MAEAAVQQPLRLIYRRTRKAMQQLMPEQRAAAWREHVGALFRQQPSASRGGSGAAGRGTTLSAGAAPVQPQQAAQQLAEDYAVLITNIAHHRELLKLYNIGLEEDERSKQMVEAVARRVGLALPQRPAS